MIYCDIPYINTNRYNTGKFDYDRFYAWCEQQSEPVFISSYEIPEDKFRCIAQFDILNKMNRDKPVKRTEKIFIPINQKESGHNYKQFILF